MTLFEEVLMRFEKHSCNDIEGLQADLDRAIKGAVANSLQRCAAIIRQVVAPPYGDAIALAFINGDLIFGRIDAIEVACKAQRETCVKIIQTFANRTFIYQEAADLIIEAIRKQSLDNSLQAP